MPDELTVESFARAVKDKYPDYEHIPDQQLTIAMLQKYPEYRDKFKSSVRLSLQKQKLASDFEKAQPESTVGTRTREAAIGVLEPFTAQNILSSAKQAGSALYNVFTKPAQAASYEGILDIAKGAVKAPVEPVKNFIKGVRTGDYDKAAYGAGGVLSQTVPAVEGGVKLGTGALKRAIPSGVEDVARRGAQTMTGSSAFKTTEPIVEKFTEDTAKTAERQAESDASIKERNDELRQQAEEKNRERGEAHNQKLAEQKNAHRESVAEAVKANREAEHTGARVEAVNRSIEEGSKRLGEATKDLDLKLREEANGKYAKVREQVGKDPGVPMSEMAEAAKEAETKLKGSSENIKQFRELIRKGEESEVVVNGMKVTPEDPLYKMLSEQGAINPGETINFDNLQGYSSELARKLAQGNLPGDVYQAMKSLKEKIDAAKTTIAERNSAGGLLKDADSFYHDYMDLLYDKDSALTQVKEAHGVKNPGEMANQFFRSNADEIAVGKLKKLRSVYSKDANAIADLTRNLKDARAEAASTKVPKTTEIPAAPKPGKAPETVTAAEKPRKVIEGPKPPTAEEIVKAKREKVEAKGRGFTELSRYDVMGGASEAIGIATGHPIAGLVPLATKWGLGFLLSRPAVIEWIARPTTADLAAISKMPPAEAATLRAGLQKAIDDAAQAGRPLNVAPQVRQFIGRNAGGVGGTSIVSSGGVQNRRDALERLGRPPQ